MKGVVSHAVEFRSVSELDLPSRQHKASRMILSDNETKVDLLNNEAIAKTIIDLVREAVGECAEFTALIEAAREYLKRPWKGEALKEGQVLKTLGTQALKVQGQLTLSDQIGPILATGTRGNPRQIKRFLNTLLLRKRTADARGFGDDIASTTKRTREM